MFGRALVVSGLLLLCLGVVASSATAQPTYKATVKPKHGGIATFAVSDFTTLDPAQPGFVAGVQIQMGYPIFDGLFLPRKDGVNPWLATGYKFSSNFRAVDIYLRPNVRFQDGTPFNSAAVAYNFHRYQSIPSSATEYLAEVTSIETPTPTTVVVHFSQPNANFIEALANTQAEFIGSPTAITREGTAGFGLMPVGAGPFKVTKTLPGTSVTYTAWPGYWDAKQRYLSGLHAIVVAAGDAVEYQDLQAGDLSFFYDTSQGIPSVIHSAQANPAVTVDVSPTWAVNSLSINTYRAPFNNQLAREAIDYCLNRKAIVDNVQKGIGVPAYLWVGSGESYYSGSNPPPGFYNYDPAKGRAIVKQLGGISFTILVNDKVSEDEQVEAFQSMWRACGMNAQVSVLSTTAEIADQVSGNYQMEYATGGGYYDPYLSMSSNSLPSSGTNKYGFSDSTITQLIDSTGATTNPATLTKIWRQVYDREALLAVNIPVSVSPNYYIFAKQLHGLSFISLAAIYDHAWLS